LDGHTGSGELYLYWVDIDARRLARGVTFGGKLHPDIVPALNLVLRLEAVNSRIAADMVAGDGVAVFARYDPVPREPLFSTRLTAALVGDLAIAVGYLPSEGRGVKLPARPPLLARSVDNLAPRGLVPVGLLTLRYGDSEETLLHRFVTLVKFL
jgi:hypothetical protein